MADRSRFIPYRRVLKGRARSLRRDPTPAEKKLWLDFLRDRPEKLTRQKPLAGYVADFYCAAFRLVIELDGDSHFTAQAERHDAARTHVLSGLGLRVLRLTNVEIAESFEGVCERIKAALRSAN